MYKQIKFFTGSAISFLLRLAPYQPLNLFPVLAVRYVRRGKDQKSVSGVAPETPISAPFVWNILSYFAYGSEVWKAY